MNVHTADAPSAADLDTLARIENRLLWLATSMVDHANRIRPNVSGIKVGGHQASTASLVSIMTSLWFQHLGPNDRVSVKPHASPLLHAINYLLGNLEQEHMTGLRAFGGLQSYPSRSKDPDKPDYSTGSVGIGATAPIWGAVARRYVNAHFDECAGSGRQYSLLGDAELDEGAIWEALLEPTTTSLGELVWIVDVNRQSLDRVVPDIAANRLRAMFGAAGWQVIGLKYGRRLHELFETRGGAELRERLDSMSNPEYQRLLRCPPSELRDRLPGVGPAADAITALLTELDDREIHKAFRNLGGHDLAAIDSALRSVDDSRPTVIFAYTIKGYGLPTEGHPQNHSTLLREHEMRELAVRLDADVDHPWNPFPLGSSEAAQCARTAARLRRDTPPASPAFDLPADLGHTPTGRATTQAALGRALMDLSRVAPAAAQRIVTVSPDVSSSTNLGGWVNKIGVWAPHQRTDWFADDAETLLHWRESQAGQHIELGIAETNLVGMLGELGATWSRWGQPLLPIGVLYDCFVERALEPWSFGMYAGGQSILVGTPSGVTLSAEGGAHQSIKTASIGIEQPGCTSYEPAFAIDLEWCLLASLARLGRPGGGSSYLRLSTRPVDQSLAGVPIDHSARERRRRQTVAGAYMLRRHAQPRVTIAAMGALVTDALLAADRLADLGIGTDVICVVSADLLFRAVQARKGYGDAPSWILDQVFAPDRATPIVTVADAHPHTLSFLAGLHRVQSIDLGVTEFGQSGALDDVYRYHRLDADSLVAACLDVARP